MPVRKPAAARRPPRKPVVAPRAHFKPAPPAHMAELTSTPTLAAHCACSGLLLLTYTVFVFRRVAAFRLACLPDPRAYQPLAAILSAARGARSLPRF